MLRGIFNYFAHSSEEGNVENLFGGTEFTLSQSKPEAHSSNSSYVCMQLIME